MKKKYKKVSVTLDTGVVYRFEEATIDLRPNGEISVTEKDVFALFKHGVVVVRGEGKMSMSE